MLDSQYRCGEMLGGSTVSCSPQRPANGTSVDVGALDHPQELGVGLAGAHPVDHHLQRLGGLQRAEDAAELPGDHQLLLAEQQLFLAGRGAVDVEGGEDAALGEFAVQAHLHVAGALELLEDHLVHARAGVDQCGCEDRQRAALLQVASRAEEALGRVQRGGVHTAGEDLAAGGGGEVVGARQAGDAVEQDDHVAAVLDHALGTLDGELGDLAVLFRGPVEGGVDHLRLGGALHVGDLFGPLVGEQDDEVHLGVVVADGVGDLLHQRGLAGLGRRHDQAALALADGAHQVHDPGGDLRRVVLQAQPLLRVQRGQVLEVAASARLLGVQGVDLVDPCQGGVLLGVAWQLDGALDLVAAAQAQAADHRQRHVDVVLAGQVAVDAQEAVAVLGADVEGAGAAHLGPVVGGRATVAGAVQQRHVALLVPEAVAASATASASAASAASAAVAVPVAVAAPPGARLRVVPAATAAALLLVPVTARAAVTAGGPVVALLLAALAVALAAALAGGLAAALAVAVGTGSRPRLRLRGLLLARALAGAGGRRRSGGRR